MRHVKFSLNGGLSHDELDRIHGEVLRVLRETGIECSHRRTLDHIGALQGVHVDGDRIRFEPSLVEEYVQRARIENPGEPPTDEVTVSGPWNCLNTTDMDTSEIRPATGSDVREMFKLVHVTGAGDICPVYPNDVDFRLQLLFLEKCGIELTETTGSHLAFSDPTMFEFCIDMYKAAGRKYHLEMQIPISPLRLDDVGLETVWEYKDRDDVCVAATAAPIPQAGMTAPLPVFAGLVQGAAEAIGAYMVAKMIGGDRVDSHPQFRLDMVDMRYMTLVYHSPDHILYQLLLKDVYEFYYGRPKPGQLIETNSKRLDPQAMFDKVSFMLTMALAGHRRFCFGAGQMSMDEVFSPAMFVVDHEIARFVTHIIKGVSYDDSISAADLIAEVGPGGMFLTHDTTLQLMRQLFDSDLFPRTNLGQWRAAGEPDIERAAIAKARQLIASHNYSIPSAVQEQLDHIYAKAVEYVG